MPLFKNKFSSCIKETQKVYVITKISWWMLFKEIIAVYYENHVKPINRLFGQNAEVLNVEVVHIGNTVL
jgi:hypothetical protein